MTKKEAKRVLKIYNSRRYIIIYRYFYSDDYSGMVLVDVENREGEIRAFYSVDCIESWGESELLENVELEDLWFLKQVNFSRIKKV